MDEQLSTEVDSRSEEKKQAHEFKKHIEEETQKFEKHNEGLASQIKDNEESISKLLSLWTFYRLTKFAPAADSVCKLLDNWDTSCNLTTEQIAKLRTALQLDPLYEVKPGYSGPETCCTLETFEISVSEDEGLRLQIDYPRTSLRLGDRYLVPGTNGKTSNLRSFLEEFRKIPNEVTNHMQKIQQDLL